ncbi:MAG TPA: HNH endonuclease [Thermoanaerobaculaceae bacterium]|nr:HNH endonuclease [Thermoanaerobaculaceae bacterium]HPS76984.1 HNH endonuclease [Thermoanaerobaculaceae bacterium]
MPELTYLVDTRVRLAAFRWLEEQTAIHGDVLPWDLLQRGFDFEGQRVPLLSQQGIFKPRILPQLPLSIRTSAAGPYDDHFGPNDTLLYAYRGTDRDHRENLGLRRAMRDRVPLIYLHGVIEGRYLATWPVYVIGDDPGALTFVVAADEPGVLRGLQDTLDSSRLRDSEEDVLRRRYATRSVRQRLHQRGFRERVLAAYRETCAICHLRHAELLDAAHIVPDTEPEGEPVVPNGLSLCRLHHAAFDSFMITVRPDYSVEVQQSILEEHDGPMLRHGLQGIHEQQILVPRAQELRPDPNLLERRYGRFRRAG